MRQWRVGTFSMGVMLLVFGLCLLWAAVRGYSLVSYVLDWWPLALVLLGLEVILYGYLRKTERLTYDLMSIVLIFVIGVGSFALYALQSVGVVEAAQRMLNQSTYEVDLDGELLPSDAAIKKVIIDNPGNIRLTVNTVEGMQGKITGHLQISAASREEAESKRTLDIATVTEQGEQLFIHLKRPVIKTAFGQPGDLEEATMFIPSAWSVEVSNGGMPLAIRTESPAGNWMIRSDGEVDLALDGQSPVVVEARTYEPRNLGGNVQWMMEPPQAKDPQERPRGSEPDIPPEPVRPPEKYSQSLQDDGKVTGLYRKGSGGANIFIEAGSIRVIDPAI